MKLQISMYKVVILFLFSVLIGFCSSTNQQGLVNIILYGNFVEPQKTYDSLIYDFTATELVDSIKITGKPLLVPVINFNIDTIRAEKYGMDVKKIQELTKNISYENFNENRLNNLFISNLDGKKIPITAVTEVVLNRQYYKPEMYQPVPECYKYNGECVAKIELFCQKKNVKKLAKFALENMKKYAAHFAIENWRFEIIKNKVINPDEE